MHQSTSLSDYLTQCWGTRKVLIQHTLELNLMPFRTCAIFSPFLPESVAQDFTALVRQRQPAQLDPWLARAAASPLEALQRFAQGLRDDYAAVKAGVTLPWNSGPVEGHINRLKMLKRQMFGRAVPVNTTMAICRLARFCW